MVRCDLHKLILTDVFEHLFEGHPDGRRKGYLLVRTCGSHVGEFLGLADIDVQVPFPGMLPDYLAAIDLLSWFDKELAPVQELVHRIGDGISGLQRNQGPVGTVVDLSLERLVLLVPVSHYRLALGRGKQIAAKPHQSARRYVELEQCPVAPGLHMEKGAFPAGSQLDCRSDE